MKSLLAATSLALIVISPVRAEWTLDNDASRVNFISTKANTAAEVHTFGIVDGSVDGEGNVTISIDLDSVDTAIEIRDERMRDMLFETGEYPSATLVAQIETAAIESLDVGESTVVTVEGQLQLHGTSTSVTIEASVARLAEDRILVASRKPVIVNAGQVGLLAGVEKLREVAGLPSISPAVPVTFVLAFDRDS
ncbi:MAG: YceI family protein [Woeseiaceae bacterium]|nr:YceI family protein [Woeseiaceae bacterium]